MKSFLSSSRHGNCWSAEERRLLYPQHSRQRVSRTHSVIMSNDNYFFYNKACGKDCQLLVAIDLSSPWAPLQVAWPCPWPWESVLTHRTWAEVRWAAPCLPPGASALRVSCWLRWRWHCPAGSRAWLARDPERHLLACTPASYGMVFYYSECRPRNSKASIQNTILSLYQKSM